MPSFAELLEATVKIITDADLAHAIVHGPATGEGSTVIVESGEIPTFAKAIHEFLVTIDSLVADDITDATTVGKGVMTAANASAARDILGVRAATYTPIMSNRAGDTPSGDDPNGAHFVLLAAAYADTEFHLPDYTAFKYPITVRNNKTAASVAIKSSTGDGDTVIATMGANEVTVFWNDGATWSYYQLASPDLSNYATKGFAIGMACALG